MPSLFLRLPRLHNFLIQHGFYPVFLSTMLTAALFVVRIGWYHAWNYLFLPWNLLLAWIPYMFSLWAAYLHRRHDGSVRHWIVPAMIWLIFFPNAPYLITDFVHLRFRWVPFWYDIGLMTAAVWSGLFLGIFSLRTMQRLIERTYGSLISWLFVAASLGLSGLGIYVGRFLRWNSWDLVLQPRAVLSDIAALLLAPHQNMQAVGVTLFFAAFLFICYLTLTAVPSQEQR